MDAVAFYVNLKPGVIRGAWVDEEPRRATVLRRLSGVVAASRHIGVGGTSVGGLGVGGTRLTRRVSADQLSPGFHQNPSILSQTCGECPHGCIHPCATSPQAQTSRKDVPTGAHVPGRCPHGGIFPAEHPHPGTFPARHPHRRKRIGRQPNRHTHG